MNIHVKPNDFDGSALKLVAGPSLYTHLAEVRQQAYALMHACDTYLATPALPANADYRDVRMAQVEVEKADMRKVLGNG